MRGNPVGPEERESADDTQFHIEPLPSPVPDGIGTRLANLLTRVVTARPLLARTLSVVAMATLLFAFSLLVWQPQLGALLSSVLFPTPTPSLRQFGAPEIPQGTGWQPAGPGAAQHIVFAPSDSSSAYTCGAPGLSSLDDPVPILDISRDHGHNWRSLLTSTHGVWCDLTVNPTDAYDVALVSVLSLPGQTSPPPSALTFYRSFNGGVTWRP